MSFLCAESMIDGGQVLIGRSLAPGFLLRTLRTFLSAVKAFPCEGEYISQDIGKRRDKAGFTLVEVIVVIVIIAILAAIGVPALTGYIDKVQDKKYILEARNYAIAVRTVIDEAYADGVYDNVGNYNDILVNFVSNGEDGYKSGTKCFSLNAFGYIPTSAGETYYDEVSDLLGKKHISEVWDDGGDGTGYWEFNFAGSSNSTAFNADGFEWRFYPEGENEGPNDHKYYIVVTYKLENDELAQYCDSHDEYDAARHDFYYSPDAGYNVYYILLSEWEYSDH